MATEQRESAFARLRPETLVEELERQAELYYEYAVKLADARNDYDEAERDLELVEAEMDKLIRDKPTEFGLAKITDKSIEKAIIRSERYRKAKDEVLRAKHRVNVCQVAVYALDHKKKSIESLAQMAMGGLYAEPRVPKSAYEQEDRKAFGGRKRTKE